MFLVNKVSRIDSVLLEEFVSNEVQLDVLREDELHPFISGNKYRKMKYNLQEANKLGKATLLTFGGAYSNHIAAVAAAGSQFGFKTIGIIRGDELGNKSIEELKLNPTLNFAIENGMKLEFVSRSSYRNKASIDFLDDLKIRYEDFYLVPEGGTNELAVKGCEEILHDKCAEYDVVCVAIGTGGTISGLINSCANHQKVIGFPALKGDFLKDEISKYVLRSSNWSLNTTYHFGGYGKITRELVHFLNAFKEETNIPLDAVYTGKMMFGIIDMIKKGFFEKGSKILAVHTGGLQGNEGMNTLLTKRNWELIK